MRSRIAVDEHGDQGTQKRLQPSQEDGVDAVAVAALEVVAAQAVLGLEMADDWLDGRAALHFAADPRK